MTFYEICTYKDFGQVVYLNQKDVTARFIICNRNPRLTIAHLQQAAKDISPWVFSVVTDETTDDGCEWPFGAMFSFADKKIVVLFPQSYMFLGSVRSVAIFHKLCTEQEASEILSEFVTALETVLDPREY